MAKPKKYRSEDLSPDYDVGFGKPPKETQFKKGQSGNPRGRPKGTRNFATTLNRTLREKVSIIENGRQRTVSKGDAVIKQLVNHAAQGELPFIRALLPAINSAEAAKAAEAGKTIIDLTDPSILAPLLEQLGRGSHIVLSPPTTESAPDDPDSSDQTNTSDEASPAKSKS